MRNSGDNGVPERMREWLRGTKSRGGSFFRRFKSRLTQRPTRFEFDLKKLDAQKISERAGLIRWALTVLALFLLGDVAARLTGLLVFKPVATPAMRRTPPAATPTAVAGGAEFDAIMRRNMFNVEGKVPPPFDQGLLDCMSQAKPSTQRLQLMGTIVMNDDNHSVALLIEEGNPLKLAVKKDETFLDSRYVAKKVERKKLCFQVRQTGEYEFIEIPDETAALGLSTLMGGNAGITPLSDREFNVKKDYLEQNILNLNEILQTARAIPYSEPGTGKFMGFLVQSIDPGSPFAQLGVRQGDILTNVNDVIFDNPGKGLEAFNRLRHSNKVVLGIVRGGEKTTLNYDVK